MTVAAGPASYPLEHDGVTYYFCCAGCRREFEADPRRLRQQGEEESRC